MCLFTGYICFSVSSSKIELLGQSLTPWGPQSLRDSALPHTALPIWHLGVWEYKPGHLLLYKSEYTVILSSWYVSYSSASPISNSLSLQNVPASLLNCQDGAPQWGNIGPVLGVTHPGIRSLSSNWYSLAGVITRQASIQEAYLSVADMDCLALSFRGLWELCKEERRWRVMVDKSKWIWLHLYSHTVELQPTNAI